MTNTIAISQNLVDAGLELKAANAIAVAMDSLATKDDLAKMEAATKADLKNLESKMATKEDLKNLEAATKADLKYQVDLMMVRMDSLALFVRFAVSLTCGGIVMMAGAFFIMTLGG